jgi:sulfite exporter TauE/SafE
MALSEREQRLLDELERGLYESDPNLAHKISSSGARTPARLIAGLIIGLIGVSLIVFAVMVQVSYFGVLAFLVMLTGLVVASSNLKPEAAAKSQQSRAHQAAKSSPRNLFEERWNKRRGD